MAVVASSLSVVCKGLMQFLSDELNHGEMRVTVTLGTPAELHGEDSEQHRLNLFFFRFEMSGFQPDNRPGEDWLLRAYCLITPFALREEPVTVGENDLRLLGEVLRILHEHPVFSLDADSRTFHIQAVFQNLGLEQINQLWSTQGDAVYRPSVLYEFSLVPVMPDERVGPGKWVGEVELGVAPGTETVTDRRRHVPGDSRRAPATGREDWAPAACFVVAGACRESLRLPVGTDPALSVWLAGEPGTEVALQWEEWTPSGWKEAGDPIPVTLSDAVIDPDRVDAASLVTVSLPAVSAPAQYVLHARRNYVRASNGASLTVRSNPLLVTLEDTP